MLAHVYNHITHEAQADPWESQASQSYIARPSQKEGVREWLMKPRDTDSQPLALSLDTFRKLRKLIIFHSISAEKKNQSMYTLYRDGLELLIFLSQPPRCCNYKSVSLYQSKIVTLIPVLVIIAQKETSFELVLGRSPVTLSAHAQQSLNSTALKTVKISKQVSIDISL